jgi:hypothetical protein
MDIHKPKAAHSWREFLTEIGTIICGILIALALEQGLEWSHWRHVLREEREALHSDRIWMYRSMLARVDFQPCVDRRLADIALIVKRHDAGQSVQLTGAVGRPSNMWSRTSAFDVALADTTFTHMPLEEKQEIFAQRTAYEFYRSAVESEVGVWKTLRSLDRVKSFTPTEWVEVRKAYGLALDLNEVMKNNLHPPTNELDWLYSFRNLPKPSGSSLRHIPWVKELCGPSIVQ